jgi:hypothetical protein
MTTALSADEEPKDKIAKKVITPKRRYFVPEYGVSVLAESAEEAAEKATKLKDTEEDGDA